MKSFIYGFILISIFLITIYGSILLLNPEKYKIKFNTNGGTTVENLNVLKNTKLEYLPVTSKKDYEFVGWYNNDELFDLNIPITTDYTLEAKWRPKEKTTYTITFDTLNGNEIEPLKLEENSLITNLPTPTKEGYKFLNWLYQNKEIINKEITKDLTVVAKYEKIID